MNDRITFCPLVQKQLCNHLKALSLFKSFQSQLGNTWHLRSSAVSGLCHKCQQFWLWFSPWPDKSSLFSAHLLIEMECTVYALEGVGWDRMPRECVHVGVSLMGKGTMVCGDTLMFNHKRPPDAGSHKPAPLLITSALNRVHCTLLWAPL